MALITNYTANLTHLGEETRVLAQQNHDIQVLLLLVLAVLLLILVKPQRRR